MTGMHPCIAYRQISSMWLKKFSALRDSLLSYCSAAERQLHLALNKLPEVYFHQKSTKLTEG